MLSPRAAVDVRVLILDPLPLNAKNHFELAGYHLEECFEELSEAQLLKRISDAHIVCLGGHRTAVYLTDEVIRSAHRLLAIGVFGRQAANVVDLDTAQSMGIPVFSAPYQHQHSTAEYIIANIVLLSRQIGDRSREIHAGTWNKVSKSCWEVRNKTLGIVGYGHVGSQLGVMAEALSLRVIFYDSVSLMPIGRAQPMDSLEGLLAESDFVSINVSKIPDNNNLFSKKEFAAMKKNASLINTSYGEAVDLEALKEAITSGHLHGAAIDVFPESVVASGSCCLQGVPKVILSHEAAHETEECHERIVGEVTHAIVQYLSIGTTVGAENYPSISAWPVRPGSRRIINVHKNVRGVLKEIDFILSAYNVGKQVLDTKDGIGYLIADINTENVTSEIVSQLALLANSIRTRVV